MNALRFARRFVDSFSLREAGIFTRFLVTERIITILTKSIDVWLLFLVFADPSFVGAVNAFLLVTPVNFALSVVIVYVVELFSKAGYDITALEECREVKDREYKKEQYIKRFVRWMLRRPGAIFWIGSWFYLDPDYVTILLRDKKDSFIASTIKITLPSTVLAMVVWVPIIWGTYYAVVAGYAWAKVIWDLIT